MKLVDEESQDALAKKIIEQIHRVMTKPWVLMEICGGQTHSIVRNGLDRLLPEGLELVHGPGCPVCVTSLEMIDKAHAIAQLPDVIFCSVADMLRVPGSGANLQALKARGTDVRIVESPLDCLRIAQTNPEKKVVFFAIGFETTAPANAMSVWLAKQYAIGNYSVLISHTLASSAIEAIMAWPENRVQAFLGLGQIAAVAGYHEYEALAAKHNIPIVITGYEITDLLEGILMTVRQLEAGRAEVENQCPRNASSDGNHADLEVVGKVFDVCDRKWRGLGVIPQSGYRLRPEFRCFDAELLFDVGIIDTTESATCISGQVLRGARKPHHCPAFGRECTPLHPLGATMVSSGGTCAAYYNYGRHLEPSPQGELQVHNEPVPMVA